jgi:hypothetical protein
MFRFPYILFIKSQFYTTTQLIKLKDKFKYFDIYFEAIPFRVNVENRETHPLDYHITVEQKNLYPEAVPYPQKIPVKIYCYSLGSCASASSWISRIRNASMFYLIFKFRAFKT